MSKASDELENQTGGEVPTAGQVAAATADETAEAIRRTRLEIEGTIRRDPLTSVAIAAGVGFLAALILRRL
jgi:ElaB/YqjD/DUF883 family membrane-anchored ribosome-binding protein